MPKHIAILALVLGGCGAACSPAVYRIQPVPSDTPSFTEPGPASDTNSAWLNDDGTITCPVNHIEHGGTCIEG